MEIAYVIVISGVTGLVAWMCALALGPGPPWSPS